MQYNIVKGDCSSPLDHLLYNVSQSLQYYRAVLMFPDFEKRINVTKSVIGVPKKWQDIELRGKDGQGYWPIKEDNPINVARQVGLPFHTCLSTEYLKEESEKPNWEVKNQYYQLLQKQLDKSRKIRYQLLQGKGLLPKDYSEDTVDPRFIAKQNVWFSKLWEENVDFEFMCPDFAHWQDMGDKERSLYLENFRNTTGKEVSQKSSAMYASLQKLNPHFRDIFPDKEEGFYQSKEVDSQIYLRYGSPLEVYCNTLMLGVYREEELLAVAQFDTPRGSSDPKDFTTPLPLELQLQAQATLQRYVPSIIAMDALDDLAKGKRTLAEGKLDKIVGRKFRKHSRPIVVERPFFAKSSIYFPEQTLAKGSDEVHPLPVLFCIKKSPRAREEEGIRRELQNKGFRTYPVIGHTENYLVSELVPSIALDDLVRGIGGIDQERDIKFAMMDIALDHVNELREQFIPKSMAEPDYTGKFAEGLIRFLSEDQHERAQKVAERYAPSGKLQECKFDKHLPNLPIAICDFAKAFDYDDETISKLEQMTEPRWKDSVYFFLQDLRTNIEKDPDLFLKTVRQALIEDDQETYLTATYAADNEIMLVGSYGWNLPIEEVVAKLPDTDISEWTYRSAREVFNSQRFQTTSTRDYFSAKQKHHFNILSYWARCIGDSDFVTVLEQMSIG